MQLRRGLVLGGEDPLVWNNIGAAHLRRGRIEEGIKSFRRALEIDPCRFDARVNLMRTLSESGEKQNALLASQIPADCHFLPMQAQKLEEERRSIY